MCYENQTPTTTTLEEARRLPALIGVTEAAALTGYSGHYISDCLARGQIKGVKFGRRWRIDTAALLRQFGISE
jgi:excisionase family DNA binding protein